MFLAPPKTHNDGELHCGLAALTGHNESLKIVHRVGMDSGIVEMVPIHCCCHKGFFVLLCATVLEAGASVVFLIWLLFGLFVQYCGVF